MMRRCLQTAFLLCIALTDLRAQAQTDPLFTASPQQLAAVKVLLDAFLSHFKDAADTRALLGGDAEGIANVRSAFHINFPNREAMGTIEYTETQARALGATFTLVTAKYHLERTKKGGGNADGSLTEVLEKTDAGWQVIFSESA